MVIITKAIKVFILRLESVSNQYLQETKCQIRKIQVRGLRRLKKWEFAFRK